MDRSSAGRGGSTPTAWDGEVLPYTICFIRRGTQLLLLERRRAPTLGLWNGVGGKLAAGETPGDGVLREVREETGLDASDLCDVRFGGVVTWHADDDGRPLGGMYAFVASLPEDLDYPTPRDTDEGILDWKDIAWVLDAGNERVPAGAHRFLRTLLDDPRRYEHRLVLAADRITDYATLPLPEGADERERTTTGAGEDRPRSCVGR